MMTTRSRAPASSKIIMMMMMMRELRDVELPRLRLRLDAVACRLFIYNGGSASGGQRRGGFIHKNSKISLCGGSPKRQTRNLIRRVS